MTMTSLGGALPAAVDHIRNQPTQPAEEPTRTPLDDEIEARVQADDLAGFRTRWEARCVRDWWDAEQTETEWRIALESRADIVRAAVLRHTRTIPAAYRSATLATLDQNQHAADIRRWLDDPKAKTLILHGPAGTGKTHAGYAALVEHVLDTALRPAAPPHPGPSGWSPVLRPQVMATTIAGLLDSLRGERDEQLWTDIKTASLVLLDDLAHVRVTDWAAEQHWTLANERSNSDVKTIITTNAGHTALVEAWGGPAMDRWRNGCVVLKFTGTSRRQPATW